MSNEVAMIVKLSMVVVFFAVMVYVGVRCRRNSVDVNRFVLGGRMVGPWITALSYGSTYFSAVIFVGYAGQFGWKFGLSAVWVGVGNAVIGSLLAWMILGRRTRIMTQQLDSRTMPEFFGKRLASKSLKIGASVIVFIFLIPYSASLYNGLSRLFGMAFGIDYVWCIILMSALTCVYVVLGGYMAQVINDSIQATIMLGGIIAAVSAVLKSRGGLVEAVSKMSEITAEGAEPGAFASVFGPDPKALLFVVLLTSLGTWGLPQMVNKFYSIRDEGAIKRGAVISTVFALFVAGGCYFLGGFGRLFDIEVGPDGNPVAGFDSIVPTMLSNFGPVLIGVVVILVLSASMSTLSSLVMASSSTVTIDLIKGNLKKHMSERQQIGIMRLLIVVFISLSAAIAILQYRYNFEHIAQLMGISWGALAGSFLAPFLFCLYWKRTTKAAAWSSFGFAVGIMVLNMLFRNYFPALLRSPINCGVFAMLAGLLIVPVVSLLTGAPDKAVVESAFAGYVSAPRATGNTVKTNT